MSYFVSSTELEAQTLRHFVMEIIRELEHLEADPQLARTLGFIRRILQTCCVMKQPTPGAGCEASVPSPSIVRASPHLCGAAFRLT